MNPPKLKKDFLLYNPLYKTYAFLRESTKWERLKSYGFAFGLLFLTFISFAILNSPVLGMACATATIAGAVMTFLHLRHRNHVILPETIFSTPAFIVSSAGSIIRGNESAAPYMAQYGTDLQTILEQDNFDEGACFRLLQLGRSNILKSADILYTSRPLESEADCFLITRTVRGQQFSKIYDKYANHTPNRNEYAPDTPLTDLKKNLAAWLEKDTELKEFISKDNQKLIKNLSSHFSQDISQLISFVDINTGENVDFNTAVYSTSDNQNVMGIFSPKVSYLTAYQEIVTTLNEKALLIDKKGDILAASYNFMQEIGGNTDLRQNFTDYFVPQGQEILDLLIKNPSIEFDIKLQQDTTSLIKTFCVSPLHDNYYVLYISEPKEEEKQKQDTMPAMDDKFYQIQKMQAVGQLAGGVAHDFNNLLTAILGHTELLLERMTPLDSAFSDLKQIEHNAHRAGKLVQQLLAFSRQQTLKPNLVNLTDILPDMNELFRRLLGEKITIQTHYGHNLSPIKIDVIQLEQILLNFAVNAKDAMPNGGTFSIKTMNISPEESLIEGYDIMPQGEYVALYVSDTGCGMPKEVAAKVFEPFFTTKEIGKGTGLGLSTVYGIVKQSNGFIFVDSREGQGTCFKIYLPAQKEETPIQEKQTSKAKEAEPAETISDVKPEAPHTKTILIAEDEHSVREFIVRTLSMRGYNILEADCGEEALELFEQHKDSINLILSDVMMPGMDGPTWIKKAKEHSDKIKVIFMSGYAEDSFRNDPALEKEGIFAQFLAKPFSLKQLTQTVKDSL